MREFRLYAITDRLCSRSKDLEEIADSLARGGADIIQLREKLLSTKELIRVGLKVRKITRRYGALLIVNDRVDVAYAIDADGIHLGQDDLSLKFARMIFNKKKIIGLSTHSLTQAISAQRLNADYIGVGPVFVTPTKPEYRPVGLKLVNKVNKAVKVPFVAIGGINEENLEYVIKAGASRVAVVRALMNVNNIYNATKSFKEKLLRLTGKYRR
jgi:thiamine-phosphate pyrophosphorylase